MYAKGVEEMEKNTGNKANVFASVTMTLVQIFGGVYHVALVILALKKYGILSAIITFFLPVISWFGWIFISFSQQVHPWVIVISGILSLIFIIGIYVIPSYIDWHKRKIAYKTVMSRIEYKGTKKPKYGSGGWLIILQIYIWLLALDVVNAFLILYWYNNHIIIVITIILQAIMVVATIIGFYYRRLWLRWIFLFYTVIYLITFVVTGMWSGWTDANYVTPIICLLWAIYLFVSQRVKNTFGRKDANSEFEEYLSQQYDSIIIATEASNK